MTQEPAPLSELDRGDLPFGSGKGANLGAVLCAGLPVPSGFRVTLREWVAEHAAAFSPAVSAALSGCELVEPACHTCVNSAPLSCLHRGDRPPRPTHQRNVARTSATN